MESHLPAFKQPTFICRPVSTPEYYHACVGASRFTLEQPRDVVCVLRGKGQIEPRILKDAIKKVAELHPAICLRMTGRCFWAKLKSDGPPPRLRVLDQCDWDSSSYIGADFIWHEPLPLDTGPTIELIVAPQSGDRSIFVLRGRHTVIDGTGTLLLLKELFRYLRNEPLKGSNVTYSDTDLCRRLGGRMVMQRHYKTVWLTGDYQEGEPGDELRRISLPSSVANLLPKTAAAFASFAHRYSDLPAYIGVPVDLRRHVPGLLSTMNFVNMLLVRINKGEGPEIFQSRLQELLSKKEEINCLPESVWIKAIPLSWLDFFLSRNAWNYKNRPALETAVVSYLGHSYIPHFCAPGFEATDMVFLPQPGSAFSTITKFGKRVEMMINLPKVLASHGRFDALQAHILKELSA